MKLSTKFESNQAICGRVVAISIFDLMTFFMCYDVVAFGSGIIFTKFDLQHLIHA